MEVVTPRRLDRVIFNRPAGEAVAQWARQANKTRLFLLASNTLRTRTDAVTAFEKALKPAGLLAGTWSGKMRAHSPRDDVLAATNAARRCNADAIVTLGGGSLTDGAKAVVLCLAAGITASADMSPYRGSSISGGDARYELDPARVLPLVTCPTTLSGGEFTALAGVSDTSRTPPRKEGYAHPLLQPSIVVFDPTLTLHTPEWLFLSTGVRSVDHCVEAICSSKSNPYTTALATAALQLLTRSLLKVKAYPTDVEARSQCQMAVALASATIRQVPFGASHGIGHVLGGTAGVPHGYTSCVMLPSVLSYNADGAAPWLKRALQVVADNCAQTTPRRRRRTGRAAPSPAPAPSASEALDRFVRALGLPRSLEEVGIARDDTELLDRISRMAMRDPMTRSNPRPIHGPSDVLEILRLRVSGGGGGGGNSGGGGGGGRAAGGAVTAGSSRL